MKSGTLLALAVIVGAALGAVSAHSLIATSWLCLIPWGVAGLLLGWWSRGRRQALWGGALYGFCISFAFLVAGYQGSAPVMSHVAAFSILSLVGAVCGVALGLGARLVRGRTQHSHMR